MRRLFLLLACAALALPLRAAPADAPNIVPDASMDDFSPTFDIWSGVDDDGNINLPLGYYPVVNDAGVLEFSGFGPGPALVDSGTGLLDLLVTDSAGHFWYFANTGTKQAPKFDRGLPLPFLLTPSAQAIQAEDMDGDGRPDLIVGNGLGEFSVVMNTGDRTPKFDNPARPELVQVKTRHDGKAWCNYLTPAYAAWCDPERKDLLMGDGTYASDNIYYLKNHGTNGKPQFDDPVVAITGDGREQLVAVPWYAKPGAKPDLLVGDRTGKIWLYPNASGKDDAVPRFKAPKQLHLGSEESFGLMVRFTAADLNGDGKPDLVLGMQDGTVQVAYNTGTAEDPKFDSTTSLKGPPSRVLARPAHWSFGAPEWGFTIPPGSFFHQMTIVGADPAQASTYEKGFTLPEKSNEKHALKFSFAEPAPNLAALYPATKNAQGKEEYAVAYAPDGVHAINITLQPNTRYEFSFDIKGEGFEKVTFYALGQQALASKGAYNRTFSGNQQDISLTSDWHHFRMPFVYHIEKGGTDAAIGFWMSIHTIGKGTYYFTNFAVHQVK